MSTNARQPSYSDPARLIIVLAIAPAIGLGIARFAYALVLPDMLDNCKIWVSRPLACEPRMMASQV
jgi:hypothetical protein